MNTFSNVSHIHSFVSVFLQNEELKQELQKTSLHGQPTDLEAEMMGYTRKKTAVERHKDQLKKIEKEKKEAQEVSGEFNVYVGSCR